MKKTKRLICICAIASATAMTLNGATPEEARQIIQEYLEIDKQMAMDRANGKLKGDDYSVNAYRRQSEAAKAVRTLGYDSFPVLRELLDGKIGDDDYISLVACEFLNVDGRNPASEGEKEALDWARKMLTQLANTGQKLSRDQYATRTYLEFYLSEKGNAASDIDLFRWSSDSWEAKILARRVASSNVFDRAFVLAHSEEERQRIPAFHPSVTNTGPQAIYVHKILLRHWEQAQQEGETLPEELRTMVVSFDADGNPVCSVDLSKYGLSMPVITPKPDKRNPPDTQYTALFPHLGETPPPPTAPQADEVKPDPAPEAKQPNKEKPSEPPEKSPLGKTFLWLAIFALAFFGSIVVWRKAKRK